MRLLGYAFTPESYGPVRLPADRQPRTTFLSLVLRKHGELPRISVHRRISHFGNTYPSQRVTVIAVTGQSAVPRPRKLR
jgi:hypothetical protein